MKLENRRTFFRRLLLGIGVLLSTLLESCWTPYKLKMGWSNAVWNGGVDPLIIESPKTINEIINFVNKAQEIGEALKMVGSGHSFSDVAFHDQLLLKPEKLNKVLNISYDSLKKDIINKEYLVSVEAGITIKELNSYLDNKNLALQNMGGYDAQTISGAIMTGTHGSGITKGPMDSQVKSITVVCSEGRVLIIEPTKGITDAEKFNGEIRVHDKLISASLIQDDNYFNTVLVSMGSCGIVYSFILEVRRAFLLKEVRTKTTWGALKRSGGFLDRLIKGERIGENAEDSKFYEIYFNPYNLKNSNIDEHTCLLTERFIIDESINLEQLSKRDKRRGKKGNKFLEFLTEITKRGEDLVRYLNKHPRQVPGFVETALEELSDECYIEKSYNVFNIGVINEMRAYGVELCFKLEDIVDAVESCFIHAKENQERGWLHSSPPAIRFVDSSTAYLSMTNNQVSAFIEIGMLVGANGADEFLKSYERMYINKYKARPHWGLDLNILTNSRQVQELYGDSFENWYKVYKDLNSSGVFNGRFSERLGISI